MSRKIPNCGRFLKLLEVDFRAIIQLIFNDLKNKYKRESVRETYGENEKK